jgi:hypothetical protein
MRTLKNGLTITENCAAALEGARRSGTPFLWVAPSQMPMGGSCENCRGMGLILIECGRDADGKPNRTTWPCPACSAPEDLDPSERALAICGVPADRRGYTLEWTRRINASNGAKLESLIAHDPAGWVWMQGDYGTGKTGAACAVVNALARIGVNARYTTVGSLVQQLFAALDRHSVADEVNGASAWKALVLDEADRMSGDWSHSQMFEILNRRYEARSRALTVIVTNSTLDGQEWGYLRDRLNDATRITMTGRSLRGKQLDSGRARQIEGQI